ncbi:MAG TPA: hypothetical protein VND64_04935 [Pirellulales bacterium]|nr:hypothetical protein [Pirellulales bacterium]
MIRAIVNKEVRETWAYAALALGLSAACVCRQTGLWSGFLNLILSWVPGLSEKALLPFIQSGFGATFGLIAFALAMTLGFRQSAWEGSQGTALYLLHLPLPRRTYFLTKLSTGIGLQLATMSLPIVWYACWAALPGTHPAPFEWSMIDPVMRLLQLAPLVYLGAFASGIRTARWIGSRLLPLVAVAIPAYFIYNTSWLVGLPVLVIMSAGLISDILLEASTRDF